MKRVVMIAGFALLLCVSYTRADGFTDRVERLEAKNAARQQDKHDAAGDPFKPANKAGCGCTSPADCTCDDGCGCANCAGPKVGDLKVTDDPARPWTYGYGREYGWNELGWYRPAKAAPTYYPPQGRTSAPMAFGGGCST